MKIIGIHLNCFYKLINGVICFVSRFENKDIYIKTLYNEEKCVSAKDLYPIDVEPGMNVIFELEYSPNFTIVSVMEDYKPIHYYLRHYEPNWGFNNLSIKYVHELQQVALIVTGTDNLYFNFNLYFKQLRN